MHVMEWSARKFQAKKVPEIDFFSVLFVMKVCSIYSVMLCIGCKVKSKMLLKYQASIATILLLNL